MTEKGVIYNSIKKENHKEFRLSEKTQKNISKLINQLNEDLISEINSDLIKKEIREKENKTNTFSALDLEELMTSNESFGDF